MRRIAVTALGAIIGIALVGCSTPERVRDLAEKTAANTSSVAIQLNELASDYRKIAELRARNVARLNARNREVRGRYDLDLALITEAGDSASTTRQRDLETWIKKVEGFFKSAADAEDQEVKALLAAQTKLDTKSKELLKVAKALAKLAKEDDLKTRAAFLAGYIKEVAKEAKQKREASKKAATAAAKTSKKALGAAEQPVKKREGSGKQ